MLPFAAGSGTDTTTRIISKELGTALGVGMVIDNKAGANGSIAANYVARQPPDGYTLFVTTNTTHSANPYLLKTMSYDPVKDFTPIARTGDLPFMLVIHPEIPANTVAELIALAKKEPGKYSYASGSSSAIVSGATFARLAGIDLLHVPYKSSPPALTDVIAGRVSMMFVDVLTGLPHVNGKALKALAVTTKQPSALLPQLPTMDATVKGFDITSWQGYLGPANMPKEMVAKLNAEIRKVVERPDIKSQLAERGMEAFSSTPEEFDAFLKEQLVLWEKLIARRRDREAVRRSVPDGCGERRDRAPCPLIYRWTRQLEWWARMTMLCPPLREFRLTPRGPWPKIRRPRCAACRTDCRARGRSRARRTPPCRSRSRPW